MFLVNSGGAWNFLAKGRSLDVGGRIGTVPCRCWWCLELFGEESREGGLGERFIVLLRLIWSEF